MVACLLPPSGRWWSAASAASATTTPVAAALVAVMLVVTRGCQTNCHLISVPTLRARRQAKDTSCALGVDACITAASGKLANTIH